MNFKDAGLSWSSHNIILALKTSLGKIVTALTIIGILFLGYSYLFLYKPSFEIIEKSDIARQDSLTEMVFLFDYESKIESILMPANDIIIHSERYLLGDKNLEKIQSAIENDTLLKKSSELELEIFFEANQDYMQNNFYKEIRSDVYESIKISDHIFKNMSEFNLLAQTSGDNTALNGLHRDALLLMEELDKDTRTTIDLLRSYKNYLTTEYDEQYAKDELAQKKVDSDIWSAVLFTFIVIVGSSIFILILIGREASKRALLLVNEKLLKETKDRYRKYIANSPDGIFVIDSNGNYIEVNDAACEMTGYTMEELLNMSISEIIAPEQLERVMDDFRILVTTGSLSDELLLCRKDGARFYIQLDAVRLGDNRYIGFTKDITERKRAEESIRQYADIVSNMNIGLYAYHLEDIYDDSTLRMIAANPAATEFTGVPMGQVLGKTLDENFPGLRAKGIPQKYAEVIRTGKPIVLEEVYYGDDRVKKANFIVKAFPLPNQCVGVLFENINERKRAEEEHRKLEAHIKQRQKLESLGVLVGGVSHDFNNILHNVSGFIDLLEKRIERDSKTSLYLDVIKDGISRGKDLTKQILAFSRQSKPDKKPLEIKNEIELALRMIRSSLPNNIRVEKKLMPGEPLVNADAIQIHQVVINLYINGIQAMPDGGVLSVSLEPCSKEDMRPVAQEFEKAGGPWIKLSISDTGVGIDETIIHLIYDPFFTTKSVGKGTGLGLSVVHGIIRDHDFVIDVHSEPGEGTTFDVYLPVIEAEKVAELPDARMGMPVGKEHVFFVDDEETTVAWMSETLQQLGYTVSSYSDGHKALDAFIKNKDQYDVVITDLAMPGLNGIELAVKIKNMRPDIPILLCTGYSQEVTPEQIKEADIGEVLVKPVSSREVSEAIHRVVTR